MKLPYCFTLIKYDIINSGNIFITGGKHMKKKLVAMALSTAMILTGALGLTAQADDLGEI